MDLFCTSSEALFDETHLFFAQRTTSAVLFTTCRPTVTGPVISVVFSRTPCEVHRVVVLAISVQVADLVFRRRSRRQEDRRDQSVHTLRRVLSAQLHLHGPVPIPILALCQGARRDGSVRRVDPAVGSDQVALVGSEFQTDAAPRCAHSFIFPDRRSFSFIR